MINGGSGPMVELQDVCVGVGEDVSYAPPRGIDIR